MLKGKINVTWKKKDFFEKARGYTGNVAIFYSHNDCKFYRESFDRPLSKHLSLWGRVEKRPISQST